MKKGKIGFIIWIAVFAFVYLYRGHVASLLIIVLSLAYLLICFFLIRRQEKQLTLTVSGGQIIQKNETLRMEAVLFNKSILPVMDVPVVFEDYNPVTGSGRECRVLFSAGGGRRSVRELLISDDCCGAHKIRVKEAWLCDALHICRRKLSISAEAVHCVMPEIGQLLIPDDYMESYDQESFQYSELRSGSDPGEVFDVRTYLPGDSLKAMHWKLSAKLGELMVKIPSWPIENSVAVILDNCLEAETVLKAEQRSALMELFCTVSAMLAQGGHRHRISWCEPSETDEVSIEARRSADSNPVFGKRSGKGDRGGPETDAGEKESLPAVCRVREISTMEELWSVIPKILQAGFIRQEASAVYSYLEQAGDELFANYFLVTAQAGRDRELLENYGAVYDFRITDEGTTE